jgi:type II secretory pathway component PulF
MTDEVPEYQALSDHELHLWGLQMHLLLQSGMPLHSGLELLAAGEELPRISAACDRLADGISQGHRLSEAMHRLHPTFGTFAVNLVSVGEKSGRLGEVFGRIAERALRRGKTEQAVRGALAYPVFLTAVSGAMAGFMAFYMFPRILPFLAGLKVELPWPTRLLIWGTSNVGWLVLAISVLAAWLGYLLIGDGTPRTARMRDWLLYHSPVFGRLNRHRVYADCLADLYLLVEAQCSLLGSLRSLTPLWNEQRGRIRACVNAIEAGSSVSEAVASSGMLPPFFYASISSAEETGHFASTFRVLAEQLEESVLMEIERLLQLLEPALMAGMGLLVGFIVVASFLPLYSLTSSL